MTMFGLGADAYFLQQLCFAVGFRPLEPDMFAPEFVKSIKNWRNRTHPRKQ